MLVRYTATCISNTKYMARDWEKWAELVLYYSSGKSNQRKKFFDILYGAMLHIYKNDVKGEKKKTCRFFIGCAKARPKGFFYESNGRKREKKLILPSFLSSSFLGRFSYVKVGSCTF